MILVTPQCVGAAGYARMVREGVIVPVLPGVALPRDITLTLALRRHVLAAIVPQGAQVTGLAALWAHGCAPAPSRIDVRCAPATGRERAAVSTPVIAHVVVEAPSRHPSPLADPGRAAADALRWSPLDLAMPAVRSVLDAGLVTPSELRSSAAGTRFQGVVAEALRQREDPAASRPRPRQRRLEPEMRRAS